MSAVKAAKDNTNDRAGKSALVTGGARRIGASIARSLHASGLNVAIHYRSSQSAALSLRDELNRERPASAIALAGDLASTGLLGSLVDGVIDAWGRLDVLVNNASAFQPTPLQHLDEAQWEHLMGTNLKAPLFLAQAAEAQLRRSDGCIVNIVDIYADRPLKSFPLYCASKAGLVMLTRSLALEMGPGIRVNAVAPGAILWPETDGADDSDQVLQRTVMKRMGAPGDIAEAVRFLAFDAPYMTGQVLTVDGGRSLNM